MKIFVVQAGMSLWDVVINSTGTLANLDLVLGINGLTDWTPELFAGQEIIIPDSSVVDQNALFQFLDYPVCNNSVDDIDTQVQDLEDVFTNNWILATDFWNDQGIWIDTAVWQD
jgi:hypothetical protein